MNLGNIEHPTSNIQHPMKNQPALPGMARHSLRALWRRTASRATHHARGGQGTARPTHEPGNIEHRTSNAEHRMKTEDRKRPPHQPSLPPSLRSFGGRAHPQKLWRAGRSYGPTGPSPLPQGGEGEAAAGRAAARPYRVQGFSAGLNLADAQAQKPADGFCDHPFFIRAHDANGDTAGRRRYDGGVRRVSLRIERNPQEGKSGADSLAHFGRVFADAARKNQRVQPLQRPGQRTNPFPGLITKQRHRFGGAQCHRRRAPAVRAYRNWFPKRRAVPIHD